MMSFFNMKDVLSVELALRKQNGNIREARKELTSNMDRHFIYPSLYLSLISESFHLIEQPIDGSKSFSNFWPFRIFLMLFSIIGTFGAISGSNASLILPWKTSLCSMSNRKGSGVHTAPKAFAVF